jgi:hypothetical protein
MQAFMAKAVEGRDRSEWELPPKHRPKAILCECGIRVPAGQFDAHVSEMAHSDTITAFRKRLDLPALRSQESQKPPHTHTARCLSPVTRPADCDEADLATKLAASEPPETENRT